VVSTEGCHSELATKRPTSIVWSANQTTRLTLAAYGLVTRIQISVPALAVVARLKMGTPIV